MYEPDEFLAKVNDKIKEIEADSRVDDIKLRKDYLELLKTRYTEEPSLKERLERPQVFVSYSEETGKEYMKAAKTALLQKKFKVKSGMELDGTARDVIKHIRSKMKPCCLFLGILTQDVKLSEERLYAPAAWVHIETGMALGLDLRVVLLYHESIADEWWKPIFDHKRQIKFTDKDFHVRLQYAVKELANEHAELLKELRGR
ncbi:MAG: hypothetical protein HY289_08670 [Planctomycetes bacterium]|nr:hypothetical protein [Planctomycetota bacterium]